MQNKPKQPINHHKGNHNQIKRNTVVVTEERVTPNRKQSFFSQVFEKLKQKGNAPNI